MLAGRQATCALFEGGEVRCRDRHGARVVARGAVEIALGAHHVCTRSAEGAVSCGALADPFASEPWPDLRARALAGTECAVRDTGQLVCRTANAAEPYRVIEGPEDVRAAAAEGDVVCVIDGGQAVWCVDWDGWARRATRVRAAEGATAIALGSEALLTLDASGAVRSIARRGSGWDGRARPIPLRAPARAIAIRTSPANVCAILADGGSEDGSLECTGSLALPEGAAITGATALSASQHACVVHDGAIACWGSNTRGAIASSPGSWAPPAPTAVTGSTGLAVVGAGICAGTPSGTTCWNVLGAAPAIEPSLAGTGASWSSRQCLLAGGVPYCARESSLAELARLEGLPSGLRELAALHEGGCALDGAGVVHCFAQTGGVVLEEEGIEYDVPRVRLAPTAMPWPEVTDIAASPARLCAISQRRVLCTDPYVLSHGGEPEALAELEGARSIAIGMHWVCAALEGEVRCRREASPGPRVVSFPIRARALAMDGDLSGAESLCAVTDTGRVACATVYGGGGASEVRELAGLDRVAELALANVGQAIGCARRDDGAVWCWGDARALAREIPDALEVVTSPRDPFASP